MNYNNPVSIRESVSLFTLKDRGEMVSPPQVCRVGNSGKSIETIRCAITAKDRYEKILFRGLVINHQSLIFLKGIRKVIHHMIPVRNSIVVTPIGTIRSP